MGKWTLAIIFLIIAIVTAVVVFSVTGVIDAHALALKIARSISWLAPYVETYERGQAVEAWQTEQFGYLENIRIDLDQRELALMARERELEQREQLLERRQAELEAERENLARERASRVNVEHLAEIYTEMDPVEAARILRQMETSKVIDILSLMDARSAALILESMPTDQAASLSSQLVGF